MKKIPSSKSDLKIVIEQKSLYEIQCKMVKIAPHSVIFTLSWKLI